MKFLVIAAFLLSACSHISESRNVRDPSSIKKTCTELISKFFPKKEEIEFEESRRAFLRGAAASVATVAVNPTQLIKVAASGSGAALPARVAILKKATKLRKGITIKGTETYQEALIRASQNPEFSEISQILIKRASQIQARIGSSEVLKNLPTRILKEGTQSNPHAILDLRIQKKLRVSRVKLLKASRLKLIKLREDLIDYLEYSMHYQVYLYDHLELNLAVLVHQVDHELMDNYHKMLLELKESEETYSELYPKLTETVDDFLSELESKATTM